VGRGHLRLVVAAAGAALVAAATAGSAVDWRKLATDPPNDKRVKTLTAFLATDRRSTAGFAGELTYADPAKLARVNFESDLLVAGFDGPTCRPHLPSVASVEQPGRLLEVRLRGPAPAASGCRPRWPGGYQLITVARAGLSTPLPTGAVARYS
jgi:hypothetical protein